MNCNVCSKAMTETVYESETSITSLSEVFPQPTHVVLCGHCGHLQTDEMDDAASFYDMDYAILTDSEEEDQIYEVRDGEKIYRTDHQLQVLVDKLDVTPGMKILDFGCAKSSITRILLDHYPDIDPYLYDVSDRYLPFWEKFLPPSRWATYDVPNEWTGTFDVVTSFFSLEHITHPTEIIRQIARLLRPGGIFYCIVPNVLTNSADLIVIDHVNHFTRSSLHRLMQSAGLEIMDLDTDAHRGAFVLVARRPVDAEPGAGSAVAADVADTSSQLRDLAAFWLGAAARLRDAERQLPADDGVAIYGAGFYGAFIRCCLEHPERIRCFIDQNPYLQGADLAGIPVVAPEELPDDIRNVFVGLNPAHADEIIARVDAFAARDLHYHYI